jgi:arylsulfatase A-like enzyme
VKNLDVDSFVSGTQLDGQADIDMGADEALLADYVKSQIPELREPFFAVLHTSNVHYPYLVEEDRPQPFQPAKLSKEAELLPQLFNHYRNAIVQHDRHLADVIAALRDTDVGGRTVLIYTSDHGEAFRDHGQSGHTFSMFDEEVRVPAFVDAPPGTLTDTERTHLQAHESRFTFHPDLMVTALDLMGVWDAPQLERFKPRILGRSLLRGPQSPRILPMSNCSTVWSCAFENWGTMRGQLKLFARTPFERGWQCFDVLADPLERQPLDNPQCDVLRMEALRTFGHPPR